MSLLARSDGLRCALRCRQSGDERTLSVARKNDAPDPGGDRLRNITGLFSAKLYCQARGCNFTVGDVVIDVLTGELLTGLI
jgi:hypothetical protein